MDINEVSYTVVNENEATTPKYTVLEDKIESHLTEYLDKLLDAFDGLGIKSMRSDAINPSMSDYGITDNEFNAICDILCQKVDKTDSSIGMKDGFYGILLYRNYELTIRIIFSTDVIFVFQANKKKEL